MVEEAGDARELVVAWADPGADTPVRADPKEALAAVADVGEKFEVVRRKELGA